MKHDKTKKCSGCKREFVVKNAKAVYHSIRCKKLTKGGDNDTK